MASASASASAASGHSASLNDVGVPPFPAFLSYVVALELFDAACMYELPELAKACAPLIMDRISPATVLLTLKVMARHSPASEAAVTISRAAQTYLMANIERVPIPEDVAETSAPPSTIKHEFGLKTSPAPVGPSPSASASASAASASSSASSSSASASSSSASAASSAAERARRAAAEIGAAESEEADAAAEDAAEPLKKKRKAPAAAARASTRTKRKRT